MFENISRLKETLGSKFIFDMKKSEDHFSTSN